MRDSFPTPPTVTLTPGGIALRRAHLLREISVARRAGRRRATVAAALLAALVLVAVAVAVAIDRRSSSRATTGNQSPLAPATFSDDLPADRVPCVAPRSQALDWRDRAPLPGGGGLTLVTARARIAGDHYAVSASITNASRLSVRISLIDPGRPGYYRGSDSFGVAYRDAPNPNLTIRYLNTIRATKFVPPLPDVLKPGEAWRGTFCGGSRELRKHHEWWVTYGSFSPGGFWLTDRTFTTP
jgi:hypothetical protein